MHGFSNLKENHRTDRESFVTPLYINGGEACSVLTSSSVSAAFMKYVKIVQHEHNQPKPIATIAIESMFKYVESHYYYAIETLIT